MSYILDAAQRMDRLLGDLLTYSHQFRSPDQPLEQVHEVIPTSQVSQFMQ